jgi:hypothetical protein
MRNSSGTEIYLVAAAQGVPNWSFEPRFSLSSPDGFTVFTNNTMWRAKEEADRMAFASCSTCLTHQEELDSLWLQLREL